MKKYAILIMNKEINDNLFEMNALIQIQEIKNIRL